jgi:osmoprotectant transport system permease protein
VSWLSGNLDLIAALTLQHLKLSLLPILLGFAVSVPLGFIAYRYRRVRGVLLTVTGLLYTIPSLALFVVLPAITGFSVLSEANLVIALTIYAVAILTRSVADALDAVDPEVRQAATALGYSGWRRFWAVEFPLAGPVMLAGLRVAAVSTIALVTVGILVGVESLGYLFTNGFQRRIVEEVLTGVVLTMLLALLVDGLLALLGRALLPWARRDSTRRSRSASEEAPA